MIGAFVKNRIENVSKTFANPILCSTFATSKFNEFLKTYYNEKGHTSQ